MTMSKRHMLRDEGGFAVLELAIAIPLLVVIVAGLCDLTVWIRMFMLANEASTAAAASFMHADSAPAASSLKESVLAACPDISGCDAKLAVQTQRQARPTTVSYSHATGAGEKATGSVSKRMVKVTCTIRRGWTSFVGPAISNAMGLGGDCVSTSSRVFAYGEVNEDGWSSDAPEED